MTAMPSWLYEKVGMRAWLTFEVYERVLRDGREYEATAEGA